MVRTWSEEVGDARSVIEPMLNTLDPEIDVEIDGGREGFRSDTVEVRLKKDGREARCIVTFEAWEAARNQPEGLQAAFREIIELMAPTQPAAVYLVTSRGIATESPDKDTELLRDIAASTEAEVLADQLLRRPKE